MNIHLILTRFSLLFCLLGVTYLYAAQKEEENLFYIEIGDPDHIIKVTGLDLAVDTVDKLYDVIEKEGKKILAKDKKEAFKDSMKIMRGQGIYRSDYDPNKPEIPYRLLNHMTLQTAKITKGSVFKPFFSYQMSISILYEEVKTYGVSWTFYEPLEDINTIFDAFEARIPKEAKKEHLQGNTSKKVGFQPLSLNTPWNELHLKKIIHPVTGESRVVLANRVENSVLLTGYHFTISVMSSQGKKSINVEGLHYTSSLQDLGNYMKGKGFEVEEIVTDLGVFDLNKDGNHLLYDVGIGKGNDYDAFIKGVFRFFVFFSNGRSISSLRLQLNEASTVGDLYASLKSFSEKNEIDPPIAILVGDHKVLNEEKIKNVKLTDRSIGITNGSRITAFQKWRLEILRYDQRDNKISIDVKDHQATFETLQKQYPDQLRGNFIISNSCGGAIIDPTAILKEKANVAKTGDIPFLLLNDPKRTLYLEYRDDTGSYLYTDGLLSEGYNILNLTMDLLNWADENKGKGLLFTQHGDPVTIENALNKKKDDLVDSMFYNPEKNSKRIQVTPFVFDVEWDYEREKKSASVDFLQPFQTLEDLLKCMNNVNVEELTAAVHAGNKRYPKPDFSKITLAQLLQASKENKIELSLIKGDTTTMPKDLFDVKDDSQDLINDENVDSDNQDLIKKQDQLDHGADKNENELHHDNQEMTNNQNNLHNDDSDLSKSNRHEKNGDLTTTKRWYHEYFYWIVVGVPIAFVLFVGVAWLLLKDTIMTFFSTKKTNDQ